MSHARHLRVLELTNSALRLALALSATALVGLTTTRPAAGQWYFDPAGYLYPKGDGDAPTPIDHLALLAGDAERYGLQRAGLHARNGRVHRFVSLVDEWVLKRRKLVFEFETGAVGDVSYRFAGEFHNSHVYEDEVTDPNEVVASGELSTYEHGKLKQRAQVQWTYSAKPRAAKFPANVPYPSGKTDLMIAAMRRDLAKVQALLAQGVNVNAISRSGETALTYAVDGEEHSVELARVLLTAGADVNLGGGSNAPLTAAARKGDATVVKLLLAAGADVNPAAGEIAPLMAAAGRGDPKLLELLLAAGANVNAEVRGFTALICEVQEIGVRNGSRESVKVLLRAGANVNAKDESGRTALSIARAARDDETVAMLLKAGARE